MLTFVWHPQRSVQLHSEEFCVEWCLKRNRKFDLFLIFFFHWDETRITKVFDWQLEYAREDI